ncbi:MAG: PEP/pyruvate-binding domain-containing protein, partial [Acidobacteriota bacterium]|nr:PEP/pyruvate-binding domain-containing protein [Acidobacteriota bacterium]
FDDFVESNGLDEIASSDEVSDTEIARVFQSTGFPEGLREVLSRLLQHIGTPLAVRSSSVLEDAIFCPFAGVYGTKMIPNNQPDIAERLARLEEAIKLVLASTFYRGARSLRKSMDPEERMAVIVQEIVGNARGERFYPPLSGVARSHDFYAAAAARPEDGVVNLALGLGKTIVDGGVSWTYSPARPTAPPPFGSPADMLRSSQLQFWCLDLAHRTSDAPTQETEFLLRADLAAAEEDGALNLVASTYDGRSDRLFPGIGRPGPRVLDFAPLLSLKLLPLNDLLRELLAIGERAAGAEVEIEFALRAADEHDDRPRLGLLQVRPMHVSHEQVTITEEEWEGTDRRVASTRVMGNGVKKAIRDLVFVKPDDFDGKHTRAIAAELGQLNQELTERGCPFVLIGFGRWGSSDPWLGIPVEWSQISGAAVIVESTLPKMNVELSQGSHFFHNIASHGVPYFMVHHDSRTGIDWEWLRAQKAAAETSFVRHVELDRPLTVKVDGRSGRGGIWIGDAGT